VAPAGLDTARLGDVAIAIAEVPSARPDEMLVELLSPLTPQTGGRALVFDHGELVGIVTPADIARAVEVRSLRDHVPATDG